MLELYESHKKSFMYPKVKTDVRRTAAPLHSGHANNTLHHSFTTLFTYCFVQRFRKQFWPLSGYFL